MAAGKFRQLILDYNIRGENRAAYLNSLLQLGNIYLAGRRYKQARFFYMKYLSFHPDHVDLNVKVGHLSKITGELEDAKKYYLTALNIKKESPQALDSLGEIYYIEENIKAKEYLQRSIQFRKKKKIPGLLMALYLDVNPHLKTKENIAGAINKKVTDISSVNPDDYINSVLKTDPKNLAGIIFKIKQARMKKNPKEYLKNIRAAIYIANMFKLYEMAGKLTWEILNIKEGRKNELFLSDDLQIDLADIYEMLANVYEKRGQFKRAIFAYKQAEINLKKIKSTLTEEKFQERYVVLNIRLSQCYLQGKKKDINKGLENINRILNKYPKSDKLFFIKAIIYMQLDQIEKAKKYIQKSIELNPNNDIYYYYYAVLAEIHNDDTEVENYLLQCLKYNSNNAGALNFLGYYYLEKNKKYDYALELIKKAIKLQPNNTAFIDSLGWAHYKLKKNEIAKNQLQIALELAEINGTQDAVIYDHLAQIFFEEKKFDYSFYYWNNAKKLLEKKLYSDKDNDPISGSSDELFSPEFLKKNKKDLELLKKIKSMILKLKKIKKSG
jgi:tetratricopeptide (TPR) repeat protein